MDFFIRAKKGQRRPCLRCGNPFASEGAHNRVCPGCNAVNSRVQVPRVVIVSEERRKNLGVV